MSNPASLNPASQNPHHHLSVRALIGALTLDVTLDLTAPWTVLFGPSGSGKSSLLRAACGLLPNATVHFTRNESGHRTTLQDDRTHLPPQARAIRWSPQHAALFPHLSVAENIAFSLRAVHHTRAHSERDLIQEAISLFQLDPLLHRRPAQLSGGERHRVSLARAFAAPHCRLLLLDEPFSGIDRAQRDDLIPALRSAMQHRNVPVLSVTHDVEEALLLNAEVITLHEGRITAQGPAHQVLAPERHRSLRNLGA